MLNQKAEAYLDSCSKEAVDLLMELAQIPAPSNQEEGVAWAISRCLEENEWERGEKG